MQSRETSDAPAQAPDTAATSAAEKPLTEQAFDQLTELAALGWSVGGHYRRQFKSTAQLAKAEWHLSGRSLAVAAALIVCLATGLFLLCCSVLLLLGYALFQAISSVAITAAALLLLQFALLYWCWRSLAYVLSQVGFSATWQQLRRLLLAKQPSAKDNHGDSYADR